MEKRLIWRSCLAALLLVLCMSVSVQAGEGNDLSSEALDTLEAQAGPQYVAQFTPASCPTANYTMEDGDTYSFEDISGTGTPLNMTDGVEVDIPIGFTFNYYCGAYTTVTVSDNGALSFDSPQPDIPYSNSCLPSPSSTTIIAPFWDDLDPTPADADIFYEVKGTAPNRRLIVQWRNISYWPSSAGRVTFQAILFEGTDKILFQYSDVSFENATFDNGISATVGIQKDGATALQYSCITASLLAGRAILFSPQVDPCPTAGYYYDDMVPYSFDDISGTGTDLALGDDASADIALPFDFSFYCASYGAARVSSNGYINFLEARGTDFSNTCLPSAEQFSLVAAFWDDLQPDAAGAVYYQVKGTAPNRRLIVQWQDVPHYNNIGNTTFQIILYETTNKILYQYQDVNFGDALYDFGAGATVGVQKDDANGVQYSCNTASLSDGLAILFTPYAQITSLSSSTIGLDYDCHRNGVWVAGETANIFMLNPETYAVEKTINLVGKVPATNGWTTGVSVLDNGNLLLADWNGLPNIDDYLFEFNPDTETLVNYWPLDGALNTSTDGTSINNVIDVDMVFEPFRRAYVTSSADQNLYEVQLTPGKPGAWKTLAVHPLGSLCGNSLGVDKVACYEDTPITGFAVSDWASVTINFYDANLSLLSNFNAGHGASAYNSGVTVVPGNPAKLWVSNFTTDTIAIFDTQQKCTMHCGKFPWHEIIGAISQGSAAP